MPRFYCRYGVLLLALAAGLWAQRGPGRGGTWRPGFGSRAGALDRWNSMSPEERERALEKLPPDRQRKMRQRLEQFNNLSEGEQQRLLEHYGSFSKLPPDKQELVRRQIHNFQSAPADRRHTLAGEFARLRRMPEADRHARISSDEFRSRYTPKEQQMLQDLSDNLAFR